VARFSVRPGSHSAEVPHAESHEPSPDELVDFGDEPAGAMGPAGGAPEPQRFGPADAVPVFRTDLKIEKGANGGLFEVTDPVSGRHFTLYEFELSIARMLDGRRHASDVIENGVRLGIPIDLDGLYKFVRQLWRYGFLAPPGVEPVPEGQEEGGWPEREKWDEATRTLFQTGLRLMRQGRPQDAQSYFQAVLDADPGNVEATEHLAAIERGESLVATPIGMRPGGGARPAAKRKGLALALGGVAVACVAAGAAFVLQRRAPPPPPPPVMAQPVPPPKPAPPPPPAWRTAAVQQREHPPVGELAAAADGTVSWKRKPGDRVKEGERIGILRVLAGAKAPAPIDPASAARIRELEALAKQDPIYKDFLEKELKAQQRKRGGKAVRDVPLVAPETGTLSLAVPDRARVGSGDPIASVVDDRVWIIDAFVDGDPPASDAACELRGDAVAERVACHLDGSRPAEGGSQLTLTVKGSEAPWVEGSRSLRVRLAPAGTPPEHDEPTRDPTPLSGAAAETTAKGKP
jgi:hypothetical protein